MEAPLRLAALSQERPFWPQLDTSIQSTLLNRFYLSSANRLMIYLCLTLLAGLATLLALEVYSLLFQRVGSPITFRGVYAWETAINLGLCHFIVDEGSYRLGPYWPKLKMRTVYRSWMLWLFAFALFMILQRTVIYARTVHYHPSIVGFYRTYPDARPDWLSMSLFCFPFWLAITTLTRQLIYTTQTPLKFTIRDWCQVTSEASPAIQPVSQDHDRTASAKPIGTEPLTDLLINNGGQQLRVNPETITHITVEDHYCRLYLQINGTAKQLMALTPLKSVFNKLPSQQFLRIHRSHVVRLDAIGNIIRKGRSYHLHIIPGDHYLPISRQRLPQCLAVLKRFEKIEKQIGT